MINVAAPGVDEVPTNDGAKIQGATWRVFCVVGDGGRLVGILSELDCLRAMLQSSYSEGRIGTVRDYMAADNLVVANPHEDITDVAQDMLDKKKRRRPVVEDGRLIGQVTCRQLLKATLDFSR